MALKIKTNIMVCFHFNYKNNWYKAQANISDKNGKVSCDVIGILSDHSDQQLLFNDLETGQLHQSEKPLMKAINIGLNRYLKNYPIDHCKPTEQQ